MKALITGMSGFVGPHLARHLTELGQTPLPGRIDGQRVDLTDFHAVTRLIQVERPGRVYHLAAQSSVSRSWQDRDHTFAVNVEGTRNLARAILDHAPRARLLFVSTGSVYGPAGSLNRPFREDDDPSPQNPYAESKVAAEKLLNDLRQLEDLDVRVARPLGHCGPGQPLGFVVPDLASQAAAIKAGKQQPRIKVGRLDPAREFAHVADVVRAYAMVMERGESGGVYNLATNEPHTVGEVLLTLIDLAHIEVEIVEDNAKVRPKDESSPRLDMSKLSAMGFRFEKSFKDTMAEVLEEWIKR